MLLTAQETETVIRETLGWLAKEDILRMVDALEVSSQKKWHEVDVKESLGAVMSVQCRDICEIGAAHHEGRTVKAFVSNE